MQGKNILTEASNAEKIVNTSSNQKEENSILSDTENTLDDIAGVQRHRGIDSEILQQRLEHSRQPKDTNPIEEMIISDDDRVGTLDTAFE